MVSAFMNIALILKAGFLPNHLYGNETEKKLATLAVGFVWYKAFYWMRLFDETAFFINLLNATFQGIMAFVIMMILLLLGVSNCLYVLNLHQEHDANSTRSAYAEDLP